MLDATSRLPISAPGYDYDAVIVGARCAGASTAMLLARKGYRVLLIDRARFPSEIPHGHFIHRHGPPRLARWGLLDRIVATGCPPATRLNSYLADVPLIADNLEVDGIAWGYGPRRAVLDRILVEAAVEAGVELQEGVGVEDLVWDADRVVGVRTTGGSAIRARLTIGADGKYSRVARSVKATSCESVPTQMCWFFTYFRDVPERQVDIRIHPRSHAIVAHPTNDGLFAVFIGWPIQQFRVVRANVETSFMAALDLASGLGERVRAGARTERFYGTGDLPQFLRRPVGPGWALVGDAGCHKDPISALGVCDALRDAELLADAAHDGLSANRPMGAALADYERRRTDATLPDFQENVRMAALGPIPPETLKLRRALRGQPVESTRFVLARHGRIPGQAALEQQES
jgi:flavin-dependent dehydrogenase